MTVGERDKIFLWALLLSIGSVVFAYSVMDFLGWIPPRYSVTAYTRAKRTPRILPGDPGDPDLVLGVLIGDTRFRLNWGAHWAMVTRPGSHMLETWIIPERFEYKGETFVVTALDSFALLNAPSVKFVSLPRTLEYMNEADTLAPKHMVIEKRKE